MRFVLYFRRHCLRFISILHRISISRGKKKLVPGSFDEWDRFQEDVQHPSLPEYALRGNVLPVPRNKNKTQLDIWINEILHSCMKQPFILCFVFLRCILLQCPHSTQYLSQGRGMDGPQRALTGSAVTNGGAYMFEFLCVCSRDLQELNPPQREKTALQYASWGPQGNQLVSQALIHFT